MPIPSGSHLPERPLLLVADLADQVHGHACQGDAKPVWTLSERHLGTALVSEIAVGRPLTASIPKTRDQPEEPNSRRYRPCGNNASTGISLVPPTRQQMRGPTSDRQHAPHLVAARRQAAPVPKTRTASERAARARPIAHLSRQIAVLGA